MLLSRNRVNSSQEGWRPGMAHKKAGGSSRNGRDSRGPAAGAQDFWRRDGASPATSLRASAAPSGIPGAMSALGRDHTLFALDRRSR